MNVLADDTDANGDAVSITAVTQGAHGSVTNNVTNVNDAPVAQDDNYSTNQDTQLNVAAPGATARATGASTSSSSSPPTRRTTSAVTT